MNFLPWIGKHVEDVELGFGSVDIVWCPESAVVFPVTLPLGLNFVKWIDPLRRFRRRSFVFEVTLSLLLRRAPDSGVMRATPLEWETGLWRDFGTNTKATG